MDKNERDKFSRLVASVLDGYELNEVVLCAIRFFLRNPYESTIIVDKDARIQFMDKASEAFFGLSPGAAKDRDVREFVPPSGLPETLRTGTPTVGRIFELEGARRIAAVYPLKKNGTVIGALGKVIFNSLEEIERINAEIQRLRRQIYHLKQKEPEHSAIYRFDSILGKSSAITDAIEIARSIAKLDTDVLIIGESGTGKELFAHSIHSLARPDRSFVKVNCPAIPFELAESELFGYEKGAFTGAASTGKVGHFEMADNGTIFLDEISSLPLSIQAKLLRVLKEREIERLGSTKTKKINFKLVSASNVDLKELVKEGKFRQDLFYRVAKAIIRIPPLRERPEDIPLYAYHFLHKISESFKIPTKSISLRAMDILCNYGWPGNARELINVLEQAAIRALKSTSISHEHLPTDICSAPGGVSEDRQSMGASTGNIRQEIKRKEKEFILSALTSTNGNKRRAAHVLNMPRSTLYEKLKRYNISGK